mmetsp:Transcript_39357/g.92786  ORF Transcript_39357/g.92786 Transcript_39357/m.92786 type:complete len:554 (+) Transcript_39357:198-1859(+)
MMRPDYPAMPHFGSDVVVIGVPEHNIEPNMESGTNSEQDQPSAPLLSDLPHPQFNLPTDPPSPKATISKTTATASKLDQACKTGELRKVEELLSAARWSDIVNAPLFSYRTPLHTAARHGHLPVVSALIVARANVNAQARLSRTPLHTAARRGHAPVVKALIQAQANVNAMTKLGATPLSEAIRYRHAGVVQTLIAGGAGVNGLLRSSFEWLHYVSFASFAAAGACFVVESACPPAGLAATAVGLSTMVGGWVLGGPGASKPLALAVKKADKHKAPNIVVALLQAGADANGRDGEYMPLHLAVQLGNLAVANSLLNMGARVNAASGWLCTMPLRAAVEQRNVRMVKLLLGARADVLARDSEGVTALHRAVDYATSGHRALGEAAVLMTSACPRALQLPVNLRCMDSSSHVVWGGAVLDSRGIQSVGPGVLAQSRVEYRPVTPLELCLRRGAYWLYDLLTDAATEAEERNLVRRIQDRQQVANRPDQDTEPPLASGAQSKKQSKQPDTPKFKNQAPNPTDESACSSPLPAMALSTVLSQNRSDGDVTSRRGLQV